MDTLIEESLNFLKTGADQTQTLTIWELVFCLTLTLFCSTMIAGVYRYTHRGLGYSQSYVQSLIITSLITSLIMIVIGSNIARAFSLVGALSIIRFRNAIKETRDVAFIFFAMAVAMASGTRFHAIALVATVFVCGVIVMMHLMNFGDNKYERERLLRVQLPAGVNPEAVLEPVLTQLFSAFSVVLVESARRGLMTEVLYSVRPLASVSPSKVIEEISKANDNLKVTYNFGMHTEDV